MRPSTNTRPAWLRYTLRTLARSPVFTIAAVLSLGLALALNTTMFALIDALRHPIVPYREPPRVVTAHLFGGQLKNAPSQSVRFTEVRDGSTAYEAIAEYSGIPTIVRVAAKDENQFVAAVSPEIFDLLGIRPLRGRFFDARETGTQEAVVSYRFWKSALNGRPVESGLRVGVGDDTYSVIGVAPRAVHFPWDSDVWIPAAAIATRSDVPRVGPLVIMRLKAGVTPEMARTELALIASRLTSVHSPTRPFYARVETLERTVGPRETFPWFFRAAVIVVLVIACANLGTMLLARGVARRRETAIRIALGASRRTIVGQVLAECGVIVAGGAALGMLLTFWAFYLLPHFVGSFDAELLDLNPTPRWQVFAVMLVVSVAMVVAAGVAPAMRAAKTDPSEPIKEGGGTSTGRVRDRYNPLVIVEVALSTALLMACALFVIYLVHLKAFSFRYAAKRLLVSYVNARPQSVADSAVERFYDRLVERTGQLPGAQLAATRYFERTDGGLVYGEGGKAGVRWMNSQGYTVVSPDYLRTIGVPVIDGRDFEAGDRPNGGAVIVDEEAAKRLWPNLPTPVGRMIRVGRDDGKRPWLRVVGVARGFDTGPRREGDLPPEPNIYVVKVRDVSRQRELVVQGSADAERRGLSELATTLQRAIEASAPQMGAPQVKPWLAKYESQARATQLLASVLGAFAAFGLVLCAIGVYGVLAYSVRRRLREFAIRIALGARQPDVARVVLRDVAVTTLAGIGIGAFFALWLTHEISTDLLAVRFADVIALVSAELVLVTVAFLACLGPLRQATTADPAQVLRAS